MRGWIGAEVSGHNWVSSKRVTLGLGLNGWISLTNRYGCCCASAIGCAAMILLEHVDHVLVIRQTDHAVLAGFLAREWGNAVFARPRTVRLVLPCGTRA